jgi:hypothetical protein
MVLGVTVLSVGYARIAVQVNAAAAIIFIIDRLETETITSPAGDS